MTFYFSAGFKYAADLSDIHCASWFRWIKRYRRPYTLLLRNGRNESIAMQLTSQISIGIQVLGILKRTCVLILQRSFTTVIIQRSNRTMAMQLVFQIHIALHDSGKWKDTGGTIPQRCSQIYDWPNVLGIRLSKTPHVSRFGWNEMDRKVSAALHLSTNTWLTWCFRYFSLKCILHCFALYLILVWNT